MEETRQNRIARLLQKELATIFQGQTRMMHGVLVSVTRVRVSPDLSICTAYLSIFPSEKSEELIENVNTNEKQIRFELKPKPGAAGFLAEIQFRFSEDLSRMEEIVMTESSGDVTRIRFRNSRINEKIPEKKWQPRQK